MFHVHELSRSSDPASARRGSSALRKSRGETDGRSVNHVSRERKSRRVAKWALLTCNRVGKSWNANKLVCYYVANASRFLR